MLRYSLPTAFVKSVSTSIIYIEICNLREPQCVERSSTQHIPVTSSSGIVKVFVVHESLTVG